MVKKAMDKMMDDYLSGASVLSRLYRRGAQDKPPARLDAAILAQARAALKPSSRRAWHAFGATWVKPASAAAVVVLGVMLVVFMAREGVDPLGTPASLSAPSIEEKPAAPRDAQGPAPAKPQTKKKVPKEPAASQFAQGESLQPRTAIDKIDRYSKTAPLALADITSVKVSGAAGGYRFQVGVKSPATGCRQYVDWWEVVSEDGRLLYRFVVPLSHANRQTFTSTGGTVPISADTVVWVRAHMHPGGYGGSAFKGSAREGFHKIELSPAFAADLAKSAPLSKGCSP